MEAAVSAPSPVDAAGSGRSNGVRPSLSSDFLCSYLLSAGVGTPRDFMAPDTCDGTVTACSGTLNLTSAPPLRCARKHVWPPGYCRNYEVLLVLSFTCVVLLVPSRGRVACWPCCFASLGRFRLRLCRCFALNERNHNR
jgi:hypothetical protein